MRPTYNSFAIESYLDRIPGLAEHFIYLNDDMFFGNNVTEGDFFSASGAPWNLIPVHGHA